MLLFFFHLPPRTGQVQLNARRHRTLAITLIERRLLAASLTVLLNDSNTTSLPVYTLAAAYNPFWSIRNDVRKIYVRIETARLKSLGTSQTSHDHR
jgi:hypothetical protein